MTKLITGKYFLPYNPTLRAKARELRNNMTPTEKQLWYGYLRGNPNRFIRQHPIDHFIVDFYCPALKLVIEVDGDSHFEDGAEAADSARTRVLEGYGLRVIRFTNREVMGSFDGVVDSIEDAIRERVNPLNPP